MPNHCQNKLTVFGPEEDLAAFVEKAKGRSPEWPPTAWDLQARGGKEKERPPIAEFCLNALHPVPENIVAQGFDKAGYDWCCAEWGTKWGAYDLGDTKRGDGWVTYEFTTAWSPPTEFLKKVSGDFSSLRFGLSFAEEHPTRGRLLFGHGTLVSHISEASPLEWDEEADEDAEEERHNDWNYRYYKEHEDWVFGELDKKAAKYRNRFASPEVHAAGAPE